MNDDLRRAMDAEVVPAPAPDVGDVWRAGRHRRSTRRRATIGASAATVLLMAGVAVQLTRSDGSETVRTGPTSATSATCDPPPRYVVSEGPFVPDVGDGGGAGRSEPPHTPAAMVHGGGSEHLTRPEIVARVKVLSVDRHPPPASVDRLGAPRTTSSEGERIAHVEVVDPVLGAEVGDRLEISDLGKQGLLRDIAAAEKVIMREIDDRQNQIDALNRPLADLDAQIVRVAPDDPRYQELLTDRDRLKQESDPERTRVQAELTDYQQRLQILQLSQRLSSMDPMGTTCHRFAVGDDLIVALDRAGASGPYELTGSSSFFLITDGQFSPELDAARRSVPDWTDSELLRLARTSTPDEFLDRLRQAAGN